MLLPGRLVLALALVLMTSCGPTLDTPGADQDGGGPHGLDAGPGGGGGGPAPDGAFCAQVEVHVDQVVPTVVLLIDRSVSMSLGFPGASNRWSAVYNTLMGTTGVVRDLGPHVRFGLTTYTSFNGFSGGTCPVLQVVAPALNNFSAIDAIYRPANLGEDTPTAASVTQVTSTLMAFPEPGPKFIILATDGLPDTCVSPDPDGQQAAMDDSVHAVEFAHTAGIDTYVVSVGPEPTADHLQNLANAGVGSAGAPYYRALDATSLNSAFDSILNGVRTCTFTMDGTVAASAAAAGHVYLDAIELPADQWQLVDSMTLELLGSACNTLLSGGDHDVSATFPCDGVEID